jgi:hypothetical protein
MWALYAATPSYEEKLRLAMRHLAVFREAGKAGLVSDYDVSEVNLSASWYALFAGEYAEAERLSLAGKARTPGYLPLDTNLAHAMALQGKNRAAMQLYMSHYGVTVEHSQNDRDVWESVVLRDFNDLEAAGITVPLFDDIRQFFALQESD